MWVCTSFAAEQAALNQLTGSGLSEGEIISLTNALRTELANTGAFNMMERSQIDEILKEQGFQATGACNDASCMVEMGQLLAVKFIFLGNVGKVGETYSVSVRKIDVGTGQVLADATENYKGEVDKLLTEVIPLVAKKLSAVEDEKRDAVVKKRKKWPFFAGGLLVAGGVTTAVILLSGDEDTDVDNTTGVKITW